MYDLIERAMRLRDDAFERWQTHDTQDNWDEYLDRQAQVARLIEERANHDRTSNKRP